MESTKTRTKHGRRKHKRDKSISILYHRYRAVVVTGMEFNKFKYGRKKRRVLWCDPMLTTLYWGDTKDVKLPTGRFNVAKAKGNVPIKVITSLIVDKNMNQSQCPLFRQKFQDSPNVCLSILTPERTIDLEADSTEARDSFAAALGNIVFEDRSQFALGEEDDDFNDEVDDVKALFESEEPDSTHAVEQYSQVYHQRKLSKQMQSEIATKANSAHKRTHSFITSVLMDKDARFRHLAIFVQATRELLGADRGSLYLVDNSKGVVESVVIEGQQGDVRSFKLNEGLIGVAAATGEIMIIPDAYADSRFDHSTDAETSYKTTSMLIGPVRDRAGRIAAVLEYRNRQDHQYVKDYFTVQHAAELQKKCIEMKEILGRFQEHDFQRTMRRVQDPLAFVNGQLNDNQSGSDAGFSSVDSDAGSVDSSHSSSPSRHSSISKRLNPIAISTPKGADVGFSLTVDGVQEAKERLDADKAALYLIDRQHQVVKSIIQEGSQDRSLCFKVGEGLVGICAQDGTPILVEDAYEDKRFDRNQDKNDCYKTTSMLCVPVKNSSGEAIAVAQFINKQDMPFKKGHFKASDYEEITPLLNQIAAGIPYFKETTETNMFKIEETDEADMDIGFQTKV